MTFQTRLTTLAKQRRQHKAPMPSVWLMTDDQRLADPIAAAKAIPKGWGLIFRHYDAINRADLASRTAAVCRSRGVILHVAGGWRLASQVGASGIHFQEKASRHQLLAPMQLWRRQGKRMTVSAHGSRGLAQARSLRADAVLLSPVYVTLSHPNKRPLGAMRFSALARRARLPVLALGGVTLSEKRHLDALGASGIAGIGFLKVP